MEWVTVNGKHIPVDDEEKKKREIDFNKKEAEKRNNAGSGKSKKNSNISKKFDRLNNLHTKGNKK